MRKDFLGNTLQEGDAVLFLRHGSYSSVLDKGIIVSLKAPKMATIQERPAKDGMDALLAKRKYEHIAKITDPVIAEQIKKEVGYA